MRWRWWYLIYELSPLPRCARVDDGCDDIWYMWVISLAQVRVGWWWLWWYLIYMSYLPCPGARGLMMAVMIFDICELSPLPRCAWVDDGCDDIWYIWVISLAQVRVGWWWRWWYLIYVSYLPCPGARGLMMAVMIFDIWVISLAQVRAGWWWLWWYLIYVSYLPCPGARGLMMAVMIFDIWVISLAQVRAGWWWRWWYLIYELSPFPGARRLMMAVMMFDIWVISLAQVRTGWWWRWWYLIYELSPLPRCARVDDGGDDIWYMSYLPCPGARGLMMAVIFDIWVISLAQVRVVWWWLWWSRRWWVTLTPSGTVPARCSPSTSGNDSANTPRSPNSWSSEGNHLVRANNRHGELDFHIFFSFNSAHLFYSQSTCLDIRLLCVCIYIYIYIYI